MYFAAMEPVESATRTTSKYEQSLSSTLAAVEDLVEKNHVNAHAHMVLADCLKKAHGAANADRTSDLAEAAILFVIQVPWLLDLFRPDPADLPPILNVMNESFLRSLFLKRVAHDATVGGRTDGGVDSQWLAQVLGFYMPTPERARSTASEIPVDRFCAVYTDRLRASMMQLLHATSEEALVQVRSALVTYVVHHQEMPPLRHICPALFRSEGDDGDAPENDALLVPAHSKFVRILLYNAPGLADWVFEHSQKLLANDFRGAACVGRQLVQAHPHRFWLPRTHNPRQRPGGGDGAFIVRAEVVPTPDDPTNPQVAFASV